MDYTSSISHDAFLKLKCNSCSNYLSHFPIYISGDKQNICGRCSGTLGQENSAQNEVYEALAQFVKFPCRYSSEGCIKTLLPKDVPTHEQTCEYEKVKCPIKETAECGWEGPQPSVLYHCQEKHFERFLKSGTFTLNLNESHQREELIEYSTKLFVVKQRFYSINKLMEFVMSQVACGGTLTEIPYRLNFSTGNRKVVIQGYVSQQPVEIFMDSLKERDGPSIVTGKIIFEKSIEGKEEILTEKVDEVLLSQLKCIKCSTYALPPIFYEQNTSTGRENHIWCTNCRKVIPQNTLAKDTNLDKIANLQNYPCINAQKGCLFIAKPPEMTPHIQFCSYGDHICPLKECANNCTWKGTGRDINAHILTSHGDLMINSDPIALDANYQRTNRFGIHRASTYKCYIIKYLDYIFCLNLMLSENKYQWSVQMVGSFVPGFMNELEIIDRNNGQRSWTSRQPCSAWTSMTDRFAGTSCYFNRDQVANLVFEEKLMLKVRIYK